MKVGDLVRHGDLFKHFPPERREVGIIINFEINYDRFGDPIEKYAVVNWGIMLSNEYDYLVRLEVISESK